MPKTRRNQYVLPTLTFKTIWDSVFEDFYADAVNLQRVNRRSQRVQGEIPRFRISKTARRWMRAYVTRVLKRVIRVAIELAQARINEMHRLFAINKAEARRVYGDNADKRAVVNWLDILEAYRQVSESSIGQIRRTPLNPNLPQARTRAVSAISGAIRKERGSRSDRSTV